MIPKVAATDNYCYKLFLREGRPFLWGVCMFSPFFGGGGFIPTKHLKNDIVSSMCKNQVVELNQINNTIKGRKCIDTGLKT